MVNIGIFSRVIEEITLLLLMGKTNCLDIGVAVVWFVDKRYRNKYDIR